ncbi:hypothetical protein O181_067768 [Austropuccinia psidii MF-1]|uniref:Uncharacterized protein n=1 Tax=Austropuccinia psidii MF-1 TaxID=1389203 RepID=A0A9Q3I4U5_9BASI|nr:hypothetical protein [Austropuccinia psidii MF-1]
MEDDRTSTSSQRLSSTFKTPIDSPEDNITAIPIIRPEPFPKAKSRDIPSSVQELVYGSKEAAVRTSAKSLCRHNELIFSSQEAYGARKDRAHSEGLETHFLQTKGPTNKSLVEKPKHFAKGPEEEVGPRKGQPPWRSSSSLQKEEYTSKCAKQGQARPKEQSEAQGKIQAEQALPEKSQNSKERKDSHGQCDQYGKNSDGVQRQGGGNNEVIISKEIYLLKLVIHFETCNKQILEKLDNFKYIQWKLVREILQVKESQKTIIGLESVTKYNILSFMHICERIKSKVTLLNQPDDNFISFITKQLEELSIEVQDLENSTGHNEALFQELLEKSDKERLELKEYI